MNLLPLISRLKKSGITIELEEEDKLKLRAPEGSLTPEILSELKKNKSALIEFLQKRQRKRKSYISIEPYIVSDGFSHGILIDEFGKLYRGEDLPGLKIQYKDYSE